MAQVKNNIRDSGDVFYMKGGSLKYKNMKKIIFCDAFLNLTKTRGGIWSKGVENNFSFQLNFKLGKHCAYLWRTNETESCFNREDKLILWFVPKHPLIQIVSSSVISH